MKWDKLLLMNWSDSSNDIITEFLISLDLLYILSGMELYELQRH